jgi:Ca2+-binding RTX toxin-like protein
MRQNQLNRPTQKIDRAVGATLVDMLESRVLMADATAAVIGTTLKIQGTAAMDVIEVTRVGDVYRFQTQNTTLNFPVGAITQIHANLGAGFNRFKAVYGIDIPIFVQGGADQDSVLTGTGNDTFFGGAGNDYADLNKGADIFLGGPDSDTIDYSTRTAPLKVVADTIANDGENGEHDKVGPDVENIYGGAGNDLLVGNPSKNEIRGGAGHDTVIGKAGNDLLMGGDKYDTPNSGNDWLFGDEGADDLRAADGNNHLFGGTEGDTLSSWSGDDELTGGAGDDLLISHAGNDTCWGGAGADNFSDDAGNDVYRGEGGNDTFIADPDAETESDEYIGGLGADRIIYGSQRAHGVSVTPDGLANDGYYNPITGISKEFDFVHSDIENVTGTDQTDIVKLLGSAAHDVDLLGGNDYVMTGAGNDTVRGGAGADSIYTQAGQDSILGGFGADRIECGSGADWANGESDNDTILGGAGNDTMLGFFGDDSILGEAGNDSILGGEQNDRLFGGADNDKIFGNGGDDQISGDGGVNELHGDFDDDTIVAANGLIDIVDGGTGFDTANIDFILGSMPLDSISSLELVA